MGRISKKGKKVDINDVRKMIRAELKEKHGGVAKFLNTPEGKILGGQRVRPYLFDSGPINFKIIDAFCKHFGYGTLTREIVVTRSFYYTLTPIDTDD